MSLHLKNPLHLSDPHSFRLNVGVASAHYAVLSGYEGVWLMNHY